MDHLQSNVFIAGQRLNDLTGYSGIEALKKEIEEQGKSYVKLCDMEASDFSNRKNRTKLSRFAPAGERSLLSSD